MTFREGAHHTGIGQAVRRVEDHRFVSGQGRFVDDLAFPSMLHAYFVRSPHAHAQIVSIDSTEAQSSPGVRHVLTGAMLQQLGIGDLHCRSFPKADALTTRPPTWPVLAVDRVRYVGEAVALIVADTLFQAKDAAERLFIKYETLPAVRLADAVRSDAPAIWEEFPGNVAFEIETGERDAVFRAFESANHVTTLEVFYPRIAANSLEPRSVVAVHEASNERLTIYTSTQTPYRVREVVASVLGLPELSIRVRALDVGGGFGMKAQTYPEEILIAWATRQLGYPVKWTGERIESIASDTGGRHQRTNAELALDKDGKILALRISTAIDIGAYPGFAAATAPSNAATSLSNTYRLSLVNINVKAMFTNSSPVAPYRGTGKPEASFVMERLIEKAGIETGIGRLEIRRRNLIGQELMPFRTPEGHTYDSGEFEVVLNKALALADWSGFQARKAESEKRGFRRGIGLALHCQRAGNRSERMEIRVAPDASVTVYAGTFSHGQGHETVFAQMVSEWLCIRLQQVRLSQGDTDTLLFGRGTFSQRSMIAGGSALKVATDKLLTKGKRIAAWRCEASEKDVEYNQGVFTVRGTNRSLSFAEVVRISYQAPDLPAELGIGMDAFGTHPGPSTFPNGCMVSEVEVDIDTGAVKVVRLCSVDDAGVVINPLTLEGQLHGSTAQGLGEVLCEEVVYEEGSGQLLTGSLMDYAMPRADDVPSIVSESHPVPAKTNLLGVKGGAEAGNVGAPAAIVNAVADALSPWHVTDIEIPIKPASILRAIGLL